MDYFSLRLCLNFGTYFLETLLIFPRDCVYILRYLSRRLPLAAWCGAFLKLGRRPRHSEKGKHQNFQPSKHLKGRLCLLVHLYVCKLVTHLWVRVFHVSHGRSKGEEDSLFREIGIGYQGHSQCYGPGNGWKWMKLSAVVHAFLIYAAWFFQPSHYEKMNYMGDYLTICSTGAGPLVSKMLIDIVCMYCSASWQH